MYPSLPEVENWHYCISKQVPLAFQIEALRKIAAQHQGDPELPRWFGKILQNSWGTLPMVRLLLDNGAVVEKNALARWLCSVKIQEEKPESYANITRSLIKAGACVNYLMQQGGEKTPSTPLLVLAIEKLCKPSYIVKVSEEILNAGGHLHSFAENSQKIECPIGLALKVDDHRLIALFESFGVDIGEIPPGKWLEASEEVKKWKLSQEEAARLDAATPVGRSISHKRL